MPSDRQLDDAVAALSARGDSVAVIRVVEAWTGAGAPTTRARMYAARAFFDLRLLDRAIMRVREVIDASPAGSPQNLDALALLVEVYLERGWKERAKQPLADLVAAESPIAAGLVARAERDFLPPEASARQTEREGSVGQLLALAERFCSTGSFMRAAGILERLRRQEPNHARAKALLWGLAGDLSAGPPLAEVLASASPAMSMPALDLSALDLPEDPEHTESVDASERARLIAELAEETADRNFPSLFKHVEAAPVDDDPSERTASMGMASVVVMQQGGDEGTDAHVVSLAGGGGSGDTQILLVLRPGEDMQAHRRRAETDRLRETFNLREYQESMGMAPGPDIADDALEEEDESIVLLARSESPAVAPVVAPPSSPIEVVERHPQAERPAAPPEAAVRAAPPARLPRRHIHPLWVGAVLVVLLLIGLAVAALVLPALLIHARGSARVELLNALASNDLPTMLQAEEKLRSRGDAAEVAELDLVIWSEFNGDPARLRTAREALDAAKLDSHRRAMLTAELELAMGNVRGASSAVGLEVATDDEERLLLSRIALGQPGASSADRAIDVLADLEQPGAPRYRIGRARALAAAGLVAPARALVEDVLANAPKLPLAQLLSVELMEDVPAGARAEAARLLLSDATLPPRIAGAASAIRVRALLGAGVPARALSLAREGLQRDGVNVDLQLVLADGARAEGHLLEALADLDSIPVFDERVWTAEVLTLLALDRLNEAEHAVTEKASESPDKAQTLRALVGASSGEPESVPEGAPSLLRASAQALVAVQALSPEALDGVEAAAALPVVAEPGSGFEAALQRRVKALRVTLVPADALTAEAQRLIACCGDEVWTHISLGRAYEQAGNRVLAAQHFDRAVALGPEAAMAWYERGRFYEDAGDPLSRSSTSWHSYLALAPSGARADRVADRVATSKVP